MTLQNDFEDLIDSLETNLTTMGVSDAEFDATTGIMGLVGKILDISPSVGGIDVITALSCELSKTNIGVGDSVVITGVLEADKDDTSQANVDLEGYLKNATIGIYIDNTLVDSAITNENGFYSYTYIPSSFGSIDIQARFDGTGTDYESANSSNVTLSVMSFTLTTDKNILSYSDSDSCTLSVQVGDSNNPVSDAEVTFEYLNEYGFGEIIDTDTSDNNGEATCTFNSLGLGDLIIKASSTIDGVTYSDTIELEDCIYYNGTGTSFTSNSTVDRQEPTGLESFEFTPPNKWELTFDLEDTYKDKRFYLVSKPQSSNGNNYGIGSQTNSNGGSVLTVRTTSASHVAGSETGSQPKHFKWVINGDTTYGYVDNVLIRTVTIDWWDTYAPYIFKWGIWNTGTATVTNIKIKQIFDEPLSLSTTKNILSYTDNDSTTLTATLLDGFDNPVENADITFKKGTVPVAIVQTDSNGEASYTYSSRGVGDLTLSANYEDLTNSIDVEDCYWYSSDGTKLTGTYNINTGYISNIENDVGLFNFTFPTDFIFSFEHYTTNTGSQGNCLWKIGSDSSNGVLIGAESTDTRIRIYDYANGTASSQALYYQCFARSLWNNFIIKYEDGIWTDSIGGVSISYSKSFTPALLQNYSSTPESSLRNLKIKSCGDFIRLSSNKQILSYSDEDSATLTATVIEDGLPVENATVTWKQGSTVLGTSVTDSNGDATYVYESQGIGDVEITAEWGLVSETYTIQDCDYYDSGLLDKTSNYTLQKINGYTAETITMGYDSTNKYISIYTSNNGGGYYAIKLPSTSNNCVFSVKARGNMSNGDYQDLGLVKWNNSNNLAGGWYLRTGSTGNGILRYSEMSSGGNTHKINEQTSLTHSTWYLLELTINNGVNAVFKIYDETGSNVLYQNSYTMDSNIDNGTLCLLSPWGKGARVDYKEIKVKSL